jgi:hypothetical protein
MVVLVSDAGVVERRRPGWLDAPQESVVRQGPEHVVHGLARDAPDFGADRPRDRLRGSVRVLVRGAKHGEALRGDVELARAEVAFV